MYVVCSNIHIYMSVLEHCRHKAKYPWMPLPLPVRCGFGSSTPLPRMFKAPLRKIPVPVLLGTCPLWRHNLLLVLYEVDCAENAETSERGEGSTMELAWSWMRPRLQRQFVFVPKGLHGSYLTLIWVLISMYFVSRL